MSASMSAVGSTTRDGTRGSCGDSEGRPGSAGGSARVSRMTGRVPAPGRLGRVGTDGSEPVSVLLVHGAWHDSWCWRSVARRLTEAGIGWIAPDLPMLSLRDDAGAVRRIVDEPHRRYVVVGHSRGGRVISFATYGATRVEHLIFLASDVPERGRAHMIDRTPMPLRSKAIVSIANDFTVVDPDYARDFFYADCDDELVAGAINHLRPTKNQTDADVSGMDVGWRAIKSTYVLSTNDQVVHPDDQRRVSERASEVVELETCHSAMMSRPDDVAEVIFRVVRRARGI